LCEPATLAGQWPSQPRDGLDLRYTFVNEASESCPACRALAAQNGLSRNLPRRWSLNFKGSFSMTKISKISVTASLVAIAMMIGPASSFAQSSGGGGSTGGAASGPSGGTGSAAGSPAAGSAGAGTAGVSGVPSGPASAGGLNNSANDPSGAGNSVKVAQPPAPGTNNAGTANSSGSSGSSMTTGSAAGSGVGGTAATGPQAQGDVAIDHENKKLDQKLKSICRGC
jgi:hypothetical protein